ncbi:MAG: hypothetical protein GKR87_05505 [Kiritimatiellae bacterium]|nr:hypothetical protein [Kiritimatiellia bacterium]
MYGDDQANELGQIMKRFPEFDVIIGGHIHTVVHDRRKQEILYTQAGYHGNWLGRVDIKYDTVLDRITEKESEVLKIGDQYVFHDPLFKNLEEDLKRTQPYLEKEAGFTETPLYVQSRFRGQSDQQQLICEAIAEETRAHIIFHGRMGERDIEKGILFEKDIWNIVPYENQIGILRLNAREIKEILEENADNYKGYRFIGAYGLRYDLHINEEPGFRIHNIRLMNSRKLHPKKKFEVAFNSYVLASGGRRFLTLRKIADRPTSRLRWVKTRTRDAVRNYMLKNIVR